MQLYHLTLAYPLDTEAEAELEALSPTFRSLFIGSQEHLIDFTYEGRRCLGKKLGAFIDLDALSFLELNFISLLKKLLPNRSFSMRAILLVVEQEQVPL